MSRMLYRPCLRGMIWLGSDIFDLLFLLIANMVDYASADTIIFKRANLDQRSIAKPLTQLQFNRIFTDHNSLVVGPGYKASVLHRPITWLLFLTAKRSVI